eukprot:gene8178-5892_t
MEIQMEEEGVRVEMESAGGKVIVIRRSAGNVKLRTDAAAAWLRWLTDIGTAKVLGAAAAAMRSQKYKFGLGDSDGNSLIVSSFTPSSLQGGTILVAMSYQGLSFICSSRGIESCPEERRGEMVHAISLANYGIRHGGFAMDYTDGEVRYQTDLPLPSFTLEELPKILEAMIAINLQTHERYYLALRDVRDGTKTGQQAIEAVEGPTQPIATGANSNVDKAKEVVKGCLRKLNITFAQHVRNGSKTPAQAILAVISAPPPAAGAAAGAAGCVTPPPELPVDETTSSVGEFADVMLSVGKITSVVGKLGDNLARGAMFQAVYTSNPVVLRSVTFDSAQRLKEFLTSIRAHGRIHHSALVGVYGVVHGKVIEQGGALRVVEDPTKWLLVTQFCALGSLSNWLDSIGHGRAQYHEYLAIRLVEEIALGMSMLHERGIVHQDLTIDNVFINDDKHAMISNFGLRAHFDTGSLKDNETLAQGLDRSGLFHLDASSLESGVPNKASDVFAFGVLLHHFWG